MNAHLERMVAVQMVSVQTQLDRILVNVTQATLETDLLAQVRYYKNVIYITILFRN
jgi:hypothetical protein